MTNEIGIGAAGGKYTTNAPDYHGWGFADFAATFLMMAALIGVTFYVLSLMNKPRRHREDDSDRRPRSSFRNSRP